jgi:hypothetical protein
VCEIYNYKKDKKCRKVRTVLIFSVRGSEYQMSVGIFNLFIVNTELI